MKGLSSLWCVRGSVPVPVDADDDGLLSRLAGVLEDGGYPIADGGPNRIVFRQTKWLTARPWWLRDDTGPDQTGPFDPGEIRRQGMKGRRVLRYDLNLVPEMPSIVSQALAAITLFGWSLPGVMGMPSTIVTTGAAVAIIYGLGYFRRGRSLGKALDRAFET